MKIYVRCLLKFLMKVYWIKADWIKAEWIKACWIKSDFFLSVICLDFHPRSLTSNTVTNTEVRSEETSTWSSAFTDWKEILLVGIQLNWPIFECQVFTTDVHRGERGRGNTNPPPPKKNKGNPLAILSENHWPPPPRDFGKNLTFLPPLDFQPCDLSIVFTTFYEWSGLDLLKENDEKWQKYSTCSNQKGH